MRTRSPFVFFSVMALLVIGVSSCSDDTVFDTTSELPKEGWHYRNHIRFEPVIEDTTYTYNFFVNLRTTQDYSFSNLFLLVHSISPAGDTGTSRIELTLARPDGKWLGKGKGPLVNFETLIAKNQKLKKGKYVFELEQNMRTNTLQDVVNIGMSIQKGEKYF